MIVMKFGGTSLADRARLDAAAAIVAREADHQRIVVVSAMGDTTDRLAAAGRAAERGEIETAGDIIDTIANRHHEAAADAESHGLIDQRITELTRLLEGAYLLREQTPRSRALLLSFGERLAAPLLEARLALAGCPAQAMDARELVVTDERYEEAKVDVDATRERLLDRLAPRVDRGLVPVVTGFIAATAAGVTTNLGRGGSDYTATLLGALLEAEEVWIWTDVDGVLTADPRQVKEARTLARISYREAAEMSYFGARVIQPQTILPAVQAQIPIWVLNASDPDGPGTVIAESSPTLPGGVKTVTSIPELALVTIDGRGMVGVPGVARRIFAASEQSRANVIMISQSSSEQTVSVVVRQRDASQLIAALHEHFAFELAAGAVEAITARHRIAVVSIIGQGMAGRPGTASRFFAALAAVRVNVLAIAQGASELSISVAIDEAVATRAVRAAHTTFGLTRVCHLVLLGCGRVGQRLLELIEQTRERMAERLGLELRLVGLCNSRRLLLDPDGVEPGQAIRRLAAADEPLAAERPEDRALVARLLEQHFTDVVVVDVTAADTAALHHQAHDDGGHVVTANKRPLSESLDDYQALLQAGQRSGARYGYETTFGAGLPVLHTLRELVDTGDQLISLRGCLSGTLGFICSQLQQGRDLAEVVAEAHERGYTEPDPREDLSGKDVARKALIIARAAGLELEPAQVELRPLIDGLDRPLDEALAAAAADVAERFARAAAAGETIRYVAEISPERVVVGPSVVAVESPIGALSGPDNILVFRTQRYDAHPIVIQGPGAGGEVTAAGVLGDVLKATRPG